MSETENMSVRVTEAEYRGIRVAAASAGTTMREWYEHALNRFLELRAAEEFGREEYRATPAEGRSVTIACDAELAHRVREQANEDNVRYTVALSTAFRSQLEEEADESVRNAFEGC